MLKFSLIGALLIAVTVVIHAAGTTYWVGYLSRRYVHTDGHVHVRKSLRILISTGLVMVTLHITQIVLWAFTYRALLPDGDLDTLEEAVYFSFVTFTTLGYGDITLSEGVRILSGIEAMNGILLVGWSTAVLFAVVQKVWQAALNTKH